MIDKSKTYHTRDGREVRIYATDGAATYPVQGAVRNQDGWHARTWTHEGMTVTDGVLRDVDLIEVKPRIVQEWWANVYAAETYWHRTRERAEYCERNKSHVLGDRLACVKVEIDCEEGEGLCDQ